jgi:hypothetical protein
MKTMKIALAGLAFLAISNVNAMNEPLKMETKKLTKTQTNALLQRVSLVAAHKGLTQATVKPAKQSVQPAKTQQTYQLETKKVVK